MSSRRLGEGTLALVVLALLGSVAIPARQTWRITDLLRQTTEVLAPSRVVEAQLQSGLAEEMGSLQGYALSGDATLLTRYRSAVSQNAARLDSLDQLAGRLDGETGAHVANVRTRMEEWRRATAALDATSVSPSDARTVSEEGRAAYEAVMSALTDLSSDLVAGIAERDDRVRGLEHWGLIANAVLVFAALAALVGVMALTVREQRALEEARRRARQEAALREAAEALAGAFTVGDVTQMIADAALKAVEGRGAFVEQIDAGPSDSLNLVVRAVAGTGAPALESTQPFAGSQTEIVTKSGSPMLIEEPANRSLTDANIQSAERTVIVVPLGSLGTPVGALFVLSPAEGRFRPDDLERASIFGHLAALAYEKVRLLEEALAGRRKLELVIQSRSRLIRGFSHDVKNPIGAADGYAELLREGIYGPLSPAQESSINRIRGSIRTALSLIDELHELARAETGHLALSMEPVDIGDVVRGLGDEFQAAARARGLSLSVAAEPDLPVIETSVGRVRQIASNLLSNAIKYTGDGSVTLRAGRRTDCRPLETGECVVLEVIDTGPGIPADRQEFIFQEFSRIGDDSKPGAGLGLAISRLLAQALGGQISVESAPGRGSTFTLWLPLHPPTAIAD
ncbi:MAG TPA: HAMP domain-containing sensor histidine kinase [Gemmatimonadaceae bacterium]|nr:HAMP domain-containing sensor histidine kinase [Gemmatimonadaceae bacterium]